ncbi:MAG: hypothetical protein JJ863_08920 [Deltaproteobacteria bacterium]|nr:hypothetical protein [Deltaproteobacteria bacterium]
MIDLERWQTTVLALAALAAIGCGDDDSLFHQSDDIGRAIEQEYCRCDPDPAGCRAEVAADYSSAADQIELDCLAANYGPYSSSLNPSFQCELSAQRDFRSCIARATCEGTGFDTCETQLDADRELCPDADETTVQMFFDAAGVCYDDRIVGPPEGGCPNSTVSGTGTVLTVSTIGRGHDVDLDCGGSDAPDVTVAWTAPSTGTFAISTLGSDYDTLIGVLAGCGGEELACNDDGEEDLTSYLELSAIAGTQYIIVLTGFSDDAGNARLSITAL